MMNDNIAERPFKIFIRRFKKQVLSVALHDTGSQRVQWRRPSTCCFSASFIWLHAPFAGLLMMKNVSHSLVEVCSLKKPGAHRVMRFNGARQSVSSAFNLQVFQTSLNFRLSWNLIRFSKASRCVSYWHLLHCFHLQEVLLLESIHLENKIVFLCVCLPKVSMHNSTQFNVCCLYKGRA